MKANDTARVDGEALSIEPQAAPSLLTRDYSEAFYSLEEPIINISRHVKVANFLLSLLSDRLEGEQLSPGYQQLLEFACGSLNDVKMECIELDELYLAKFNHLVRRENTALGGR